MPGEGAGGTGLAAEGLRREDSLEVKVRALLAERRQAKGYITELQAAITSCQ